MPAAGQDQPPEDSSAATATARPDLPGEAADARTRTDIRAEYGSPDAFTILYFDEPQVDGSMQATSMERWSYFDAGVEFTVSDELVVAGDLVELEPGSIAEPVPYDPDQFSAYMSLDEVVAAADLEEYIGGAVDDIVEGGELFFGDRLVWGVKDGELRYVEALALEAADALAEVE